ncbi:MAG: DNA polymerase III subunit gamma/tau [Verrucomicrobiae bacterium]|nr:DNA polymerase III subunit gamma/tau [Verrucomicrobiae bacterium]
MVAVSENPSGSYEVFARKYRPRTFDDVLGQDHVVQTLKNAITQDRLAHAYLFVGPRGTGKTTTARILAKALNCKGGPKVDFDPDEDICREIAEGRSLDVLEIDGASNRGIDEIRGLRETVGFAPSSSKFRVYYIDEVHMLTPQAFNALLKTLEEPPPHVKFIFATTEPDKILPTVLSRCQRFDLRRIPSGIIADHLLHIAENEGITLSGAAAFAIAKGADGGMRDAQSMLDQLVAFCGESIDEGDVLEIFGFNSLEKIAELAGLILERDTATVLGKLHEQSEAGRDLSKLLGDLITHFRLLLVQIVDPGAETEEIAPELLATLERQRDLIRTDRLLHLIDLLAETDGRMKWAPNKKLHLEIGLIKAIRSLGEVSIDDVIALLDEAAGAAAPRSPAPPGKAPARAPQRPAPALDPVVSETKPSSVAAEKPAPQRPAEPTPAARPEPAAPSPTIEEKPLPKPAPPSGPVSGAALWDAVFAELVAQRPLIETWLRAASFLQHEGHVFAIGYPTELALYRDSVLRHKDLIEETLARFAGRNLELRVDLSSDLEVVLEPFEDEDEENENEAGQSDSQVAPETSAADGGGSNGSQESESATDSADDEPAEPVEDFYDDPLIKKALDIFEATHLKPNS